MYKQGSYKPSNSALACCQLSLVGAASVGWDGGGIIFVCYMYIYTLRCQSQEYVHLRLPIDLQAPSGSDGE